MLQKNLHLSVLGRKEGKRMVAMHNLRSDAQHTGEARGKGLKRTLLLIEKHLDYRDI